MSFYWDLIEFAFLVLVWLNYFLNADWDFNLIIQFGFLYSSVWSFVFDTGMSQLDVFLILFKFLFLFRVLDLWDLSSLSEFCSCHFLFSFMTTHNNWRSVNSSCKVKCLIFTFFFFFNGSIPFIAGLLFGKTVAIS